MPLQAATGIENLKMQSPTKKPIFSLVEAQDDDEKAIPLVGLPPLAKPEPVAQEEEPVVDANEDEPLLRENSSRFVLFPIRYHEVSSP